MIYRERIRFTNGNIDPIILYATTRGEVSPYQSSEIPEYGHYEQILTTRYRVMMPPTANLAAVPHTAVMEWRGNRFHLEGSPVPHTIAGRVHHWELMVREFGAFEQ